MSRTRMMSGILFYLAIAALPLGALWHQYFRFLPYRSVVASAQKDPESSKFTDERINSGGTYCARVNSKNGYGGYGGAQRVFSDGNCFAQFEDGEVHAAPEKKSGVESLQCSNDVSTRRTSLLLDTQIEYLKRKKAELDRPDSARTSEGELRRASSEDVFRSKWRDLCN